jgi:hypothetical protein
MNKKHEKKICAFFVFCYLVAMKKITFRKPKILSFRLSTRKVGGIRFVRVGKLVFSFCVSKKA